MLPFLAATIEEFAAIRSLFARSGYSEANVCARTGVERIEDVETLLEGRAGNPNVADALDVLIRLFIDCLPVPIPAVDTLLAGDGLEALKRLSLLAEHPRQPGHYAASVRLYPTHGLYIASDLETDAPGLAQPEELGQPDHVFSAITSLTGTFLSQLPTSPCERFLELCGGTGIAALLAARTARESWTADITERATHFATFNARLNDLPNVKVAQGDLYEPVRGLTFDRIVAHPPYVPATETRFLYRDGGQDGEEIIRRILHGLPDYLEPGGSFYLTCVATDRREGPLEERFRRMLGHSENEFDLLLVVHYEMPPPEYYGRLAAAGRIPYTAAEERTEQFRELGAERVVYCSMVLRRQTAERAPFTLRRERGVNAANREAEWLIRWWTRAIEEKDLLERLLDSRARLLPHGRLEVIHRVEDGEWRVESSRMRVGYPFVRTIDLSLNAAMLLTLFDGERTGREIFDRLQSSGALPQEATPEGFAEFIRELVTEGVLALEETGEPEQMPGSATVASI